MRKVPDRHLAKFSICHWLGRMARGSARRHRYCNNSLPFLIMKRAFSSHQRYQPGQVRVLRRPGFYLVQRTSLYTYHSLHQYSSRHLECNKIHRMNGISESATFSARGLFARWTIPSARSCDFPRFTRLNGGQRMERGGDGAKSEQSTIQRSGNHRRRRSQSYCSPSARSPSAQVTIELLKTPGRTAQAEIPASSRVCTRIPILGQMAAHHRSSATSISWMEFLMCGPSGRILDRYGHTGQCRDYGMRRKDIERLLEMLANESRVDASFYCDDEYLPRCD
jgi:hypothetical protein